MKIIEDEPTATELLISDLNTLRRDAGGPSLSQLVRLSDRRLTKSTLDDHLSGRRRRLPSWRLVSAYVSACHEAAASTGLDVERLGTIDEWHARWSAAFKRDIEGANSSAKSADTESRTLILDKDQRQELADILALGQKSEVAETPIQNGQGKWTAPDRRHLNSMSPIPVIQQLEEDLLKLGQSLPVHSGLLIVTSGPAVGTRFAIEHNITTVGRDPESDIWLNDPTVSRHHAVIRRHGGQFLVQDSGSTNGTFFQRSRVISETLLSSYAELRFAIFSFLFIEGGQDAGKIRKSDPPLRSRFAADIAESTHSITAFVEGGDDTSDLEGYEKSFRPGRLGRRLRRPNK